MKINKNRTIDASIAVALVAALVIVALFDRAPAKPTTPDDPGLTVRQEEAVAAVQPHRLAVTPRQYDDMGKLLQQLGEGYKYTQIRLEDLEHAEKVKDFDVIFLTCGLEPESWLEGEALGAGERPGVQRFRFKEDAVARFRETLRGFVGRGGTLYTSDWRLKMLRLSFPELFDGSEPEAGAKQRVEVQVVDPGLRDLIGSALSLNFDMRGWEPSALSDPRLTTYLEGEYQTERGGTAKAPLLVKVPFEKGTIIFTSFHNEKNNSAQELELLRFLVFAGVTAKDAEKASNLMVSGGFTQKQQSLLGASPENPSVTKVYHNKKAGRLRFVLSFAPGARFRLVVNGPGGKTVEKDGVETFTVDVPDAPAGDWSYTITGLKLPYANFPFTLTVGGV